MTKNDFNVLIPGKMSNFFRWSVWWFTFVSLFLFVSINVYAGIYMIMGTLYLFLDIALDPNIFISIDKEDVS